MRDLGLFLGYTICLCCTFYLGTLYLQNQHIHKITVPAPKMRLDPCGYGEAHMSQTITYERKFNSPDLLVTFGCANGSRVFLKHRGYYK